MTGEWNSGKIQGGKVNIWHAKKEKSLCLWFCDVLEMQVFKRLLNLVNQKVDFFVGFFTYILSLGLGFWRLKNILLVFEVSVYRKCVEKRDFIDFPLRESKGVQGNIVLTKKGPSTLNWPWKKIFMGPFFENFVCSEIASPGVTPCCAGVATCSTRIQRERFLSVCKTMKKILIN